MRARLLAPLAVAVACAVGLPPATVEAQAPAEVARARALFAEGEAAAQAERWDEAIDRFERVRTIKETPGVVFHLAAAREGAGQLAQALTLFERSRELARAAGVDDVLTLADERITALGHRVSRVIVRAGEGAADVRLDGRPLAATELGVAIRVDPGKHRVEATVAGAPVVREIELAEGAVLAVPLGAIATPAAPVAPEVPEEPAPAPAPAPERPPTGSEPPRPVPVGPIVLGASGLALGGVGVGVFLAAAGENSAGEEACAAGRCDPGVRDTVQALDRVALGFWIGAAAAVGGAAVWWALDDGPTAATASVSPQGVDLRARF